MNLTGVPSSLLAELRAAAVGAGVKRLAIVGGAVRDGLLHERYGRVWTGVPDLDWILEGDAMGLAAELLKRCGEQRELWHGGSATRWHCLGFRDGAQGDIPHAR